MRQSHYHLPTLREDPADAELISHKLLLRAGLIRKIAAGIYDYLPVGLRALRKVERIVREEMDRSGGLEVQLPGVVPSELWVESGRWSKYGKELLRLKDRHSHEFCIGPTHEEAIVDLVRQDLRSYRELPRNFYQIGNKFRDEVRPRFGLMRGREFLMKDGYSFHPSYDDLDREYENMRQAYSRVFERCGLRFRVVEADTGAIGGSSSHEFTVLADAGEDAIASCNSCSYTANVEKAEARATDPAPGKPQKPKPEEVHTPNLKTVEEVAAFLGMTPHQKIKTMIYDTDLGPVVALVRGDDTVNEIKLKNACKAEWVLLASDETVRKVTGAPPGFAGPVGLKIAAPIYADHTIQTLVDAGCGANREDYHLIGVNPGRDFQPKAYVELRTVRAGDACPRCPNGKLDLLRGIEVGHIFKLGTRYSEPMGLSFLAENGEKQTVIMGTYGIGVSRTLQAAVEQNHDADGIIFPHGIAPFDVHLVCVNANQPEVIEVADRMYDLLRRSGVEVLYDDRDERPGIKFKDADLLGLPVRMSVGAKGLKDGVVEFRRRKDGETSRVALAEVETFVKTHLLRQD
ncbi:MAG: proline--tRNA ligase [Deltaproteobacteria bacterium]|nr:proline--tRNA ligase [Deltaproteobacteria bacterium]